MLPGLRLRSAPVCLLKKGRGMAYQTKYYVSRQLIQNPPKGGHFGSNLSVRKGMIGTLSLLILFFEMGRRQTSKNPQAVRRKGVSS